MEKNEEDYAAVDFKNAVFEAGKLVFDVGVTPLQPKVKLFCPARLYCPMDSQITSSAKRKISLMKGLVRLSENRFWIFKAEAGE